MPTTITGTDGVSQVQTGAVESGDLPAGSVIQVVSTTKTDTFSTNSANYVQPTGLSASITPNSTSNKILAIVSMIMGFDHGVTDRSYASIFRDGSNLSNPISPGDRRPMLAGVNSSIPDNSAIDVSMHFLDSPNTISNVTYDVRISTVNPDDTLYINRSANDGDSSSRPRGVSTITLMEIAG